MGLLRSLAKRVAAKIAPASTAAPTPHVTPHMPPPAPQTPPAAAPRHKVAVMEGEEGPVADADALATIEAGAQEVKERVECGEPVVLLDVREPHETVLGVIAGARIIPLSQLEARWKELADCNEVVCYCAAGMRSHTAATMLRKHGIFNATSLEGGVAAWQALGGKLVPPA